MINFCGPVEQREICGANVSGPYPRAGGVGFLPDGPPDYLFSMDLKLQISSKKPARKRSVHHRLTFPSRFPFSAQHDSSPLDGELVASRDIDGHLETRVLLKETEFLYIPRVFSCVFLTRFCVVEIVPKFVPHFFTSVTVSWAVFYYLLAHSII